MMSMNYNTYGLELLTFVFGDKSGLCNFQCLLYTLI